MSVKRQKSKKIKKLVFSLESLFCIPPQVSASDPSLQDALLSGVAELVVMAPPTSVSIREQDEVGQRGRAQCTVLPSRWRRGRSWNFAVTPRAACPPPPSTGVLGGGSCPGREGGSPEGREE